jgi:hypothetical protein
MQQVHQVGFSFFHSFVTFGVTLHLNSLYLICVISTEGQSNVQNVAQSSAMCSIWNAAFGTLHVRRGDLITYKVWQPYLYIHFTPEVLFAASYFTGLRNVRHWIEPANTSKGLLAPANKSDNRWPPQDGVCEMKSLVRYFVSVTFCMPVCPPLPHRSFCGQIPHKANSLVRGIELKLWVFRT